MNPNKYTYVDSIQSIYMIDGVLRIDLSSFAEVAPNAQNKEPVSHNAGGVAMSVNGFVRIFNQMNEIANKMLEQGLLKKNEPGNNSSTNPTIDSTHATELKAEKVDTKKKA